MDIEKKAKALADFLNIDVEEIELSPNYGAWTDYRTPMGLFNVMTESEAQDELYYEVKEALIEYGFKESDLKGWYDEALQWTIINNCLDNDKLRSYVNDEEREKLGLDDFGEIFYNDDSVIDFGKVAKLVSEWKDYGHFLACYDNETNYTSDGLLVFKQTDEDGRSQTFLQQLGKVLNNDAERDEFYKTETKRLLDAIPEDCIAPVWDYDYCELEESFVGFIDQYAQLNIPHDFTIIDVGCYQAVQAYYFKDHSRYIGVEPEVPVENRLIQTNAEYYEASAQTFVETILPKLVEDGLDLQKTFAICSAVPDEEAQTLVAKFFPYHQVTYPSSSLGFDVISSVLPSVTQRTKSTVEIDH